MSYNVADQNYATGAPLTVDVNGVPVVTPPRQIASPATSLQPIQEGVSTQLVPPSDFVRALSITNVGTVPVYVSNTDPGSQAITPSQFGTPEPFTYTGSRIGPGEEKKFSTRLPLYATVRPFGGTGLVSVVDG